MLKKILKKGWDLFWSKSSIDKNKIEDKKPVIKKKVVETSQQPKVRKSRPKKKKEVESK